MLASIVSAMLFIQVILGGATTLLGVSLGPHILWGVISFVAALALVYLVVREFGTKSTAFRISIAALLDFIIQGSLGFVANSTNSDGLVLVHLTNAFIMMTLYGMLNFLLVRMPVRTQQISATTPS
jgi:heme A synthase